jgi:hypothetical protein
MKTLLALTALLLSATVPAWSEEPRTLPLDGFLGIKWGTSDDAAKAQIVAKAKAHYNPKESTEKRLRFEGGEFAGFKVHHFLLAFENGGFHFSETQLVGITKNHRKEFLIFKQLLTEKYGAPNQEDQDADDLSATWYFQIPNQPANHISLFSSPNGPGLRFIYSSEGTKLARKAAPAPPLSVPASAKNDL